MARSNEDLLDRFLSAQDRLVLQASDLSLESISAMVERGAIDLAPEYQRRDRWGIEKQSALIESFILNIPVPPIYLSEDDFGRYSIIDGKQRITAISHFLEGTLRLRSLESVPQLEGLRFSDLPDEIQNALSVRPYVRVVTLLKQSDPVLKYEVFTRLNRGGEKLNAQEIRNVAYRGPLNELIYRLSETPFLKQQLKIANKKSPAYTKMDDAEYVLRFLALSEVWKRFSGSFARSMDQFMSMHQHASSEVLNGFENHFVRALKRCQDLWGDYAFKRPVSGGWRDQIIAGMYDAEMIAASMLSADEARSLSLNRRKVIGATTKLVKQDREFENAIRTGTNTPSRVQYRVTQMHKTLRALV